MDPSTLTSGEAVRELLTTNVDAWNLIFNYVNSMSLKCAIDLGIPDIIHKHGKPCSLSDLVAALQLPPPSKLDAVRSLMRVLVHSGFFDQQEKDQEDITNGEEEEEELYSLNPTSRLFLRDEPFTAVPQVVMHLDPATLAMFSAMSTWFRSSNRTSLLTAHPYGPPAGFVNLLQNAMTTDSWMVASFVVNERKEVFEGLSSMVDVGGGRGTMAKVIASAFPGIKCTVLDRPVVVADLEGTTTGTNLCYVGGDMFQAIPSTDAVLLKLVLHNWNDENSLKLLNRCKEAIRNKKRGKVIIIDIVIGDKEQDKKLIESQLFSDMLMLMVHNSKERTEKEWKRLLKAAGFTDYKITPLPGLYSLIEAHP